MSELSDNEAPLKEPFWQLDSVADSQIVDAVLRRRFPHAYAELEAALDEADPLDVVYEGNPGEYRDVIREILVLLAPINAELSQLSPEAAEATLREGIARRFGEPPDDQRLRQAVLRIIRSEPPPPHAQP